MRCPLCEVPMKEVERRGVLVDICPECRGVWLDRGELDKLVATVDAGEGANRHDEHDHDRWDRHKEKDDEYRGGKEWGKKKRRGLLGDLFDLDF